MGAIYCITCLINNKKYPLARQKISDSLKKHYINNPTAHWQISKKLKQNDYPQD